MTARLLPLLLVAALAACGGKSADDFRGEAQSALDAGDAAKALQLADEGLKAVGSDKAMAWRLHQVRLEALARSTKGAEVAAQLETLSAEYAAQTTAALYRSLADKARAAGDNTGAIDILAAGDKKFPEDPNFKKAIEDLKSSGVSPEEVEKLKALGYL